MAPRCLHPWNILHGPRYYDWGDSVVAPPFAAMLVPFGYLQHRFGDAQLARACDAYLGVFADRAPRAELVATLDAACRVAKIARTLTWERAIQAAREQGEAIDPDWRPRRPRRSRACSSIITSADGRVGAAAGGPVDGD